MSSATIDRIIEVAESQARSGGYNAFSFREIAKEIGIKSASIHYHFPTKADLASELAKRYTEKFNQHLYAINESKGTLQKQLTDYAELFHYALKTDQKMCLCGLFAAEIDALPDEVKIATRAFFEAQLDWLNRLFTQHHIDTPNIKAIQLLATMEGAMLLAKAFESEHYFKKAINLSAYE